ncbi:MAG: hypothetical protein WC297_00595 [Candidatus Paceibacterota bacterium]
MIKKSYFTYFCLTVLLLSALLVSGICVANAQNDNHNQPDEIQKLGVGAIKVYTIGTSTDEINVSSSIGKDIKIHKGNGSSTEIYSDHVFATTTLEVEVKVEKLSTSTSSTLNVKLSNGRKAEVKIMPNQASEVAIKRLGDLGFNVQLREASSTTASSTIVYELDGHKQVRLLGLFRVNMLVKATVNAEDGTVVSVARPWWSFLSSGK